jgi:hypothetical protein
MENTKLLSKDEQLRQKARKIKGFILGLVWYIVINIFLFWLDYRDNSVIDWAYWVLFGWGIGVLSQLVNIVVGSDLEDAIYNRLKK